MESQIIAEPKIKEIIASQIQKNNSGRKGGKKKTPCKPFPKNFPKNLGNSLSGALLTSRFLVAQLPSKRGIWYTRIH